MNVTLRSHLATFAVMALIASTLSAQDLTGSLVGAAQDEQGKALVGAAVRVASPSLIGGPLQAITSDAGRFRFPVLAPGIYVLTVELAPQFGAYREEHIRVGAGSTIARTVVLKPAGVSEFVSVQAVPTFEPQGSGLETRFDEDYLKNVPTRRYSMFDYIRSAPGMSPTSPSSGTVNTVSAFGSAVNENAFLIDGTNFTCPCQGVSRAEPSVDAIQEIHVQSTGASVEFGNIQGAVFDVITKHGGQRHQFDASYYGQPAALTSEPTRLAAANGGSSGYQRVRYRDFTTNLGGPIIPERLWFFLGYQYLRDYDSQPGADPALPRKYEQNKVFAKLTWRLTPSIQVVQSFHQEAWVNPTVPTATTPFVATQRVHASVPSSTFANVTQLLNDRTYWDVRVGRFSVHQDSDPSSGDRVTPSRRDQVTSVVSQNAPQMDALTIERLTFKAVFHHFHEGWFATQHDFKAGTQFERGAHHSARAFPGGVQYVDSNDAPFQAVFRSAWIGGGQSVTSAFFASDSVSLKDRWVLDAGIRFDHSRAISPDLATVDPLGREIDGLTKGLGTLYSWNVLSPRLGLTKRSHDGQTMLRASYGRFDQGVLTGELEPIHPGVTPIRTMAFDAATGGYTRLVSVVDATNLALDPRTRTPHTDEYSLALDRQIVPRLVASAAYVRKRGTDFIGWADTAGQYQEQTRTLADGSTLPVFVLTNGTAARRFLLTNPAGLFLHYDGLVVAMEKRLARGWQALGSYTFARTYGLQVTSNAPVAEAQFSTIARPSFLTFGQDPNDLTNAAGRLANDRPHIFRAESLVHVPWKGILLAGTFQHFTGRPWAATAQVALPQSGRQRVLIEPRGSRRLSSQSLLDVRVAKSLSFGSVGKLELRLDVLNLLNEQAEETLQSDVLFDSSNARNKTFGLPMTFVDPRRAMLSARVNFGG